MTKELLGPLQRYVAVSSISAAAVRGHASGVLRAARDFATATNLSQFAAQSPGQFRRTIDGATEDLRRSLPRGAQSWGIARKVLNLFLRDAFYNYYLRRAYHLERSERWYEVPLDAKVAEALIARLPDADLPKWTSIKGLSRADSDAYQHALSDLGVHTHVARVHLDTILWLDKSR